MTKWNTNHFFCSSACLDLSQMVIPSCKGCLEKILLLGRYVLHLNVRALLLNKDEENGCGRITSLLCCRTTKALRNPGAKRPTLFLFFLVGKATNNPQHVRVSWLWLGGAAAETLTAGGSTTLHLLQDLSADSMALANCLIDMWRMSASGLFWNRTRQNIEYIELVGCD